MNILTLMIIFRSIIYIFHGYFALYFLKPRMNKVLNISLFLVFMSIPVTILTIINLGQPFRAIVVFFVYFMAYSLFFKGTFKERIFTLFMAVIIEFLTDFLSYIFIYLCDLNTVNFMTNVFAPATIEEITLYLFLISGYCILYPLLVKIIKRTKIENSSQNVLMIILLFGMLVVNGTIAFNFIPDINTMSLSTLLALYTFFPLAIFGFIIWFLSANKKYANAKLKAEYLDKINQIQSQHTDEVKEQNKLLANLRHDMKTHFIVLENLIEREEYTETQQYLKKFIDTYNTPQRVFCRNNALDAVISSKAALAENLGINVKIQMNDDAVESVETIDLCSLFSNLMQNAIEACTEMKEADKEKNLWIRINVEEIAGQLIISQKNTAIKPEKDFKTKKSNPDEHGLGLIIIDEIAKKYKGRAVYEHENGVFSSAIRMECKEKVAI